MDPIAHAGAPTIWRTKFGFINCLDLEFNMVAAAI